MDDLIVVVDYNSNWPIQYEQEKQRLLNAIAIYLEDIQHVGSTSVPGLAAKPIIDIAATLRHFPPHANLISTLEELGYMYQGELGIPGRYFFRRGIPRTHHLHLVQPNSEVWQKQLLFRDFLRAHPEAAQRYDTLKRELAVKYDRDRQAYVNAKAPLIAELLAAANEWKL
ncbi:MAG TPA: GrpB family protein [Kamptonema sp.]|nr:GrpB family protein [Kamptonema sp.]